MSEKPERADAWTASFAIATATAFAQMARVLADKGVLQSGEIEILRHSALLGFDEVRERTDTSPETLEALELARGFLEDLWASAVRASEVQAQRSKDPR